MNQAVISVGLSLALLAALAQAQTVGAGARAIVAADALPVYTAMSESGGAKATLKRGDRVTIGMVLFGSDTTWCAISRVGETKRLGYTSCEFLESDNSSAPAAAPSSSATPTPSAPPPPPPVAEPKPVKQAQIKIRELPVAPITVHEVTPAAIEPPGPAPPAPLPTPAPTSPPTSPLASEPAKSQNDLIDTVLDGSGLRAELANYTQSTRLAAFLDKGRLAEIDSTVLDRILSKQFQASAFLSAIRGEMGKNYSGDRLTGVIEWVQSPVARKLAEAEQRAYSPVSRQALVEFADTLTKTPPPEARLLLVHRIYNATRICDLEVEATIALVYTTAQAIDPALPKEKRYSSNELDRALGGVKSRYRSVMKNARIVHLLFAYQSASDAELEQYAAFLESDSGMWLISAIDKGFFTATESISEKLREEIHRQVKARQH
jgi:hypothetical protein